MTVHTHAIERPRKECENCGRRVRTYKPDFGLICHRCVSAATTWEIAVRNRTCLYCEEVQQGNRFSSRCDRCFDLMERFEAEVAKLLGGEQPWDADADALDVAIGVLRDVNSPARTSEATSLPVTTSPAN